VRGFKCARQSTALSARGNRAEKILQWTAVQPYEVESWNPEPDIFLHGAAQMGVQAKECLVVEDSPVGVSAGKAAGMPTVLYDPMGHYGSLSFDFKISCMSELPALVHELSK